MNYEDSNERNHFFRDLIVKVLLVLLFIFLLMWLFPMPNLSPFYDKIFAENIETMKDAAKSYFTTSRLPEEEGETKILSLQEMLDNKMIIEFTDSDGKTCDTNKSYVEVKKEDGEYIFKTYLSCDSQEDYTIEYFGCYDVCEDDSCDVEEPSTEKITEYKFFKKITEKLVDKYICKDGYTLSGTKCILKTTIKDEKDAKLSCSTGYTYNSNTEKCEKSTVEEFDAYKKCADGYIYASSMNKCIKLKLVTETAEEKTLCSDGSAPVNGKCTITTPSTVPADEDEVCSNGTAPIDGKCTITTPSTVSADEDEVCSNGTEPVNGKCAIETDAKVTYSCSDGKTPVDGKCLVSYTYTTPVVCTYLETWSCSYPYYAEAQSKISTYTHTLRALYEVVGSGYLHEDCYRNKSCTGGNTATGTKYIDANKSYSCSLGDLSGTKCITYEDAAIEYSCDEGTLSGNKCIISTTTTTDSEKGYSCTEGTLSGTKCIVSSTTTTNPTTTYVCDEGILSGNKCTIQKVVTTNYTLYCPYGLIDGNKCYVTTSDKKDPSYTCETGYKKIGDSCYKFTTTTTKTVDAEVVYKTTTKTVYKWSTSKTLEGWTYTGESRTTTVSSK